MCPLSVTDGWMSEFNKFCSTLRVLLYVGDKKHRRNLRNSMHETLQRQSASSNVAQYFISSSFLELLHLLLQLVEFFYRLSWISTNFFCLNLQELPFDVLLTTYDITLLDQDFLSQIPWDYAVIDEAQRLKNPSSVCLSL